MIHKNNLSDSDSDNDTEVSQWNSENADSQRLGVWKGWPVHLGVSSEPTDAPVPQDFGVNLYVINPDGENDDIARIDTAHRGCHMDRLYLEEGVKERHQDYTVQYQKPENAVMHFLRDKEWAYYVSRYHENHGLPEEGRVYK